jgi:putative Mn2+ efflux pump MntP
MPFIGYLAGSSAKLYIEAFDYWIAFLILLIIGVKMIIEGNQKEKSNKNILSVNKLIIYSAFATSIDALAVGIGLSLINVPLYQAVGIIGFTAFLLTFIGTWFGKRIS